MFDLTLQGYRDGVHSFTIPWKEALMYGVQCYEINYQDANENGELDVRVYFHQKYLPNFVSNLRPFSIRIKPCGTNWMVMHWLDDTRDYQGLGFLFAYRKERTDEWEPVDPGSNSDVAWEVDATSGNLIGSANNGGRLFFPAWQANWPDALINVKERSCYADGVLKSLLLPADDNPLTALLKSPQPYKGHATRLMKTIKRIISIR